jgi:hypothetical protein
MITMYRRFMSKSQQKPANLSFGSVMAGFTGLQEQLKQVVSFREGDIILLKEEIKTKQDDLAAVSLEKERANKALGQINTILGE